NVPIFGVWMGVAAVLVVAVVATRRAAAWAGLAIAFVDVPMVFWSQSLSVPVSPSPGGVAGFSLGIFVLLVMLGALSLSRAQLLTVVGTSMVCEVLLQREAHIGVGAQVAAVVVLGLSAAGSSHLIERIQALVGAVTREERRRARLGRYFSPT